MKKYRQGIYKPKNALKFIGSSAVYRSSYELKFFQWCDENSNVIAWGSENIIIPYINPNNSKLSRYHVDNFIVLRTGTNSTKKYLVEIKPEIQTRAPSFKPRTRKSTILYEQARYNQNQAKWLAANEWCKHHNAEFVILTEKDLFISK